MPVTAITDDYRFPSRSRRELYGDDLLVHVLWQGNPFFAAGATFRVPAVTRWADFVEQTVEPWASGDPDHRPGAARTWSLDGKPFDPRPDSTVDELGVGHKSLLAFRE